MQDNTSQTSSVESEASLSRTNSSNSIYSISSDTEKEELSDTKQEEGGGNPKPVEPENTLRMALDGAGALTRTASAPALGRESSSSSISSVTGVGVNANTPAGEIESPQDILDIQARELADNAILSATQELEEAAAAKKQEERKKAGPLTRASSVPVTEAEKKKEEEVMKKVVEWSVKLAALEAEAAKKQEERKKAGPLTRASSLPVTGSRAAPAPAAAKEALAEQKKEEEENNEVKGVMEEILAALEAAAEKKKKEEEAAAAKINKLDQLLDVMFRNDSFDSDGSETLENKKAKVQELLKLAKEAAEKKAAELEAALAAAQAALEEEKKKAEAAAAAAKKKAEEEAAAAQKKADDLAAAQKEVADAKAALAAAQNEVADAKAALEEEKKKAEAALAAAQNEVADAKAALEEEKKKAAAAQADLAKVQAELAGAGGAPALAAVTAPAPAAAEEVTSTENDWRPLYEKGSVHDPDDDNNTKKSALFYTNFTISGEPSYRQVNFNEVNNLTEIGEYNKKADFVLRINKVKFEEDKQPTFDDNRISSLSSIDFNSTNIDKKGGFLYGTRKFPFSETNKIHISEKSANKLNKYQNELYKTALEELKKPTSNKFSDDEAVRDQQLRDLCSKISGTFSTSSTPDIFSILRTQISGTRHPASSSVLDSSSTDKNAIDAIFEKMAVKIADNIVQNRLLEGDYKIQKQPTSSATSPAPEELPAIKITRNNDDKHKTKINIDATGKFDDSLKFLYINFGPYNQYYLRIELERDSSSGNNKIKENSLQIFTQHGNKTNKFRSLKLNEPDGKEALKTLKKYKIDIITNPGGVNNIFERTRITVDARNNKIKTKDSNIYSFSAPTPAPAATAPSPAPAATAPSPPPAATAAAPAITLAKTKSCFACCCSYFFSSSSITATNIHGEYELNKAHGWLYDDKITTDNTTDSHLRQLKPVNHLFSHFYKDNKVTAIETKIKDNSKNTSITLEKSRKWGGFVERTKSSTRTWSRAMIELSQGGVVSSGR